MKIKRKKKTRGRWVIKVGSAMVMSGGPILMRTWMEQIVKLRREHNVDIIWVSSGAIASAVNRTAFAKTKTHWQLSEKQALSAIGQPILMELYNLALHATGLMGAQVLLTADDLADRKRRENFTATLEQLLAWDIVPILNENDAIATEEIKFGDNDSLSAKVAGVMKANRLIILTDVDGLFESDPRLNSEAPLIRRVKKVTPSLLKLAGESLKTGVGTGGMLSKIRAADEASRKKVETILVRGDTPSILLRIAEGDFMGTVIEARK